MKLIYSILEKEICEKQIKESLDPLHLKNLIHDTDILFFTISRLQMKKGSAPTEEAAVKKLCTLTDICRKDFYRFADYLCEFILCAG